MSVNARLEQVKVNGPIEPLGDNDACNMQHPLMSPLMSCRSGTWDNASLASLQVYMAHLTTDNNGGGWMAGEHPPVGLDWDSTMMDGTCYPWYACSSLQVTLSMVSPVSLSRSVFIFS
jgi:hypothetical protein